MTSGADPHVKSPLPAQAGGAPVTPPALESALAKLRECADKTMFAEVTHEEAAALLAKIEAADRLVEAAEDARLYVDGWKKHHPGWNGNWFDIKRELEEAVAAYRNPQPPGGVE